MDGYKEGLCKPELNKGEKERKQSLLLHCFSSSIMGVLMSHRSLDKMSHKVPSVTESLRFQLCIVHIHVSTWSFLAYFHVFHGHVDYMIPIRYQSSGIWAHSKLLILLVHHSMWGINLKLHSALEMFPGS